MKYKYIRVEYRFKWASCEKTIDYKTEIVNV